MPMADGAHSNLVDIYEIEPQDKALQSSPAHTYAHAGQEARMARYQTLLPPPLSWLSSHDDLNSAARVDSSTPEDDPSEMQKGVTLPSKMEGGDALVGNFADAVAAMRANSQPETANIINRRRPRMTSILGQAPPSPLPSQKRGSHTVNHVINSTT